MLAKFWRALRERGSDGKAVAGFIEPADLPARADAGLAQACLRAIGQAAAGDGRAAVATLERAAARHPADPLPRVLAADLALRMGDARAAGWFDQAVALDGALAVDVRTGQHFYARGRAALDRRDAAGARRCLELARRLAPAAPAPLEMLGIAGYLEGDSDAARACYDQAIALSDPGAARLMRLNRLINTIAQVYASEAHLQSERDRFEAEVEALLADPPRFGHPLEGIRYTCFFLGYQGRNDRDLNQRFAQLMRRACPALDFVAPAGAPRGLPATAKPRLGIVSAYLGRHSVGVWYRALVRRLIEGGRFEVLLFHHGDDLDPRLADAARSHGTLTHLPGDIDAARARIGGAGLDLLVYTDVAMHPFLYLLAFSRLAPVQALLVGHPATSGIPTIDFFISNEFQDGPGAQAHYSERLVRLPRIPVLVEKVAPPARPMTRAGLGMASDLRYYACPMMLQKMHPEFDHAIAAILRRDAAAEFVLFADRERPLWQAQLEARFARVMPDVAGRIVFRPHAVRDEFLSFLTQADCLLDPFHFSGGVTTHIALSLGVPVVTLPGELFRSRMSAGIYAQAGITGCVADSPGHFVELALALAADPVRRRELRAAILAAHPRIFDTVDAVDMLADWLERASRGQGGDAGRERELRGTIAP
jgi:tetratricopeptide (TPR) repeat protein